MNSIKAFPIKTKLSTIFHTLLEIFSCNLRNLKIHNNEINTILYMRVNQNFNEMTRRCWL